MPEQRTHDSRFAHKLVIGILCMALGGAFLLHNLNLVDAHQSLRFWPLALVILGLERIITRGFLYATGGHVLVLLGIALQMDAFERAYLWQKWWPLAIVWLGLLLTLRALLPQLKPTKPQEPFCQDLNERQP